MEPNTLAKETIRVINFINSYLEECEQRELDLENEPEPDYDDDQNCFDN